MGFPRLLPGELPRRRTQDKQVPRHRDSRQAQIKRGKYVEVCKHGGMGCAVVSLTSGEVRHAMIGQTIIVHGVSIDVRAHVDKETKEEVVTDVFCAWGHQVEKSTPLPVDEL